MQVKYGDGDTPLRNEHEGFVFQSSNKFNIATVAKRNDRARYAHQHQRQIPLMASNQHWRNLSPGQRQNWIDFAAAFPEPAKANPDKFLSGYQLFCKRQQYVFLNGGITEPWMLAPIAPELNTVTFSASLNAVNHCIDVTELYIQNFGILPKVGQFVYLRILPYQTKGAKFYPVFEQTAEITEVYMDGFFVSLSFPKSTKDITFAVFLSFPVSKNSLYQSSKIRYMGCFTVKSFLDLSDTPDSYEGQAGKVVKVKSDESGLEFGSVQAGTAPDTVTSVTTNTEAAGKHTHALNPTGVTAGSYSPAAITVDAKGRITAASNALIPAGAWTSSEQPIQNGNGGGSNCVTTDTYTAMYHYMFLYNGNTFVGAALHVVSYAQKGGLNIVNWQTVFNTIPSGFSISFEFTTGFFTGLQVAFFNALGFNVTMQRSFSKILAL